MNRFAMILIALLGLLVSACVNPIDSSLEEARLVLSTTQGFKEELQYLRPVSHAVLGLPYDPSMEDAKPKPSEPAGLSSSTTIEHFFLYRSTEGQICWATLNDHHPPRIVNQNCFSSEPKHTPFCDKQRKDPPPEPSPKNDDSAG